MTKKRSVITSGLFHDHRKKILAKELHISRIVCDTIQAHLNLKKLIATEQDTSCQPQRRCLSIYSLKSFSLTLAASKPCASRNELSDNSLTPFRI